MGRKAVELTGLRFGMLVVLRKHPAKRGKHTAWVCRCDCGNEIIAIGTNLIRPHTTSCGCARTTGDLTGRRFGKLVVMSRDPNGKQGHRRWACRCDCGKSTVVNASSLVGGITISCGCARSDAQRDRFEDLTGKKFGRLLVLGRSRGRSSHWECRCDCGQIHEVYTSNLTRGTTRSCGCLNVESATKTGKARFKGNTIKGYRVLYRAGHPNAAKNGQISEHVYVMSEHLGRPLRKGETVHHKNGVRCDNRIDNLELWSKSHPPGQRVDDILNWCVGFLLCYLRPAEIRKRIRARVKSPKAEDESASGSLFDLTA